jgi:hypothetical protein
VRPARATSLDSDGVECKSDKKNQEANGINSVGIPVFFIDVSLMLVLAT